MIGYGFEAFHNRTFNIIPVFWWLYLQCLACSVLPFAVLMHGTFSLCLLHKRKMVVAAPSELLEKQESGSKLLSAVTRSVAELSSTVSAKIFLLESETSVLPLIGRSLCCDYTDEVGSSLEADVDAMGPDVSKMSIASSSSQPVNICVPTFYKALAEDGTAFFSWRTSITGTDKRRFDLFPKKPNNNVKLSCVSFSDFRWYKCAKRA